MKVPGVGASPGQERAPSAFRWAHLGAAVRVAVQAAPGSAFTCVGLTAAGAAVPVAAAWLTKLILDRVSRPPVPTTAVLGLAAGLAAAAVVSAILPQTGRYLQARLTRRAGLLMVDRLYTAVEGLHGLRPFEDPRFLDRLRLAQQATGSPTQVFEGVLGVGGSLLAVSGFVASLTVISPVMTAVLLGSAVPALAAQVWLSRAGAAGFWRISPRQRREGFYAGPLTNVQAAKEIRLFNAGPFLRLRMRRERLAAHAVQERLDRRAVAVHGALALMAAGLAGGGLIWAVGAAADGRLTVGDITMFVASVAGVQGALGQAIGGLGSLHQSAQVYDYYETVRRERDDLARVGAGRTVSRLKRGIELRDVWFRYSAEHPWVLRGVTAEIPSGRTVALVGRNGSGKSTLVRLLCRLYDPTRGAVLWDGVDVRELPIEELRARISTVFQDYMRYELTAAENVALADIIDGRDGAAGLAQVARAAELAGVDDVVAALPGGYRTLLTRSFAAEHGSGPGAVLSGGQWQRLALARALFRDDADLLILDEPSSGLDAEAEYEIHSSLARYRTGRASVLISHRLSTVRDADRILVLVDGRIAEAGDHAELVAAGGTYARLFAVQARGYQDKAGLTRHPAHGMSR